jgi:hypothetical protein
MLTDQNIEAELSYAYLHAVATRGGFSCEYRNRHLDGAGVDATVSEDGRKLASDSVLTAFALDVQLKTTYQELPEQDRRLSFVLSVPHYDKLRLTDVLAPRILVVLRLPRDPAEWLTISEDALIARRCAYWVSLRGAPASGNERNQTVYLPRDNVLSPQALTDLMTHLSRRGVLNYAT